MYLPKILEDLKYSSIKIGVILAIIPMVRFLMPFLFLRKFKLTKKVFLLSLFLSLIASIMLLFTIENYYLLLFSNLLAGIGMTITYPYIELLTMDVLKEKYGKSRLYGSIGFIFIGLIASDYLKDYKLILYLYILATLIFVLISISMLSDKNKGVNDSVTPKTTNGGKLNFNKKIGFWISVFLIQVSFGSYYNFFTVYEGNHGISMRVISYLWAFAVICEVLVLFYQDFILKFNLIKIIKIGIVTTIIRWFLLFFFPSNIYISFFTQGMHAISFALYYSATILYLYKVYKDNRKIAMLFLSGISYGLGGVAGSLLAGATYGKYLFLYSAIISIFGLLALYLDKDDLEVSEKGEEGKEGEAVSTPLS